MKTNIGKALRFNSKGGGYYDFSENTTPSLSPFLRGHKIQKIRCGTYMKLLRIKAIAKKELIQIWRDPLSLAMAFMMPVMLLFLFGYAITLDVNNLKTVVYDLDHSVLSRELVDSFRASGYFTVVGSVHEQKEIDSYLDSGRARVAISIRIYFQKDQNRQGDLYQIIVDGSDSNTAT
jgi:ABC-2 type transport system permease protein